MQLFYDSSLTPTTTSFQFSKDESRHIIKVLRKHVGDLLNITNGFGDIFTAEIIDANEKKCRVNIIKHQFVKPTRSYKLHIAIAPTKLNDRLEWFLEKATELGVDEITPLLCANSERKIVKENRLEKVVVSAMKQSLQYHLPKINPLTPFNDFLKGHLEGTKLIAHCDEQHKVDLKSIPKNQNNYVCLIGPEGDFSPQEIETALQQQFIPLSLGPNRLRTETAGITICAALAMLNS